MLQAKPNCASAEDQYVSLNHIVRKKLNMEPVDAAKYVDCSLPGHPDIASDPKFGHELRVYGTSDDHFTYMIHQDDVSEFITRILHLRGES